MSLINLICHQPAFIFLLVDINHIFSSFDIALDIVSELQCIILANCSLVKYILSLEFVLKNLINQKSIASVIDNLSSKAGYISINSGLNTNLAFDLFTSFSCFSSSE
jgi:hypothetical protein